MKKILIFFFVLLFSSICLYSQDTIPYQPDIPCTSDSSYPTVGWLGHPTNPSHPNLIFIECGGCYYLVEWWYRQTGIRIETQISKVSKIGNCSPGCSFSDVKRFAYMDIWEHLHYYEDGEFVNYDEYGLLPYPEEYGYAVQESQCHHIGIAPPNKVVMVDASYVLGGTSLTLSSPFINLNSGIYYINLFSELLPCTDICCRMFYYVERDSTDRNKIVDVEWTEIGGFNYLDQEECETPPETCTNTCEDLRWNWDESNGIYFGEHLGKLNFDIEKNLFENEINLSPNPVIDELEFIIQNKFNGLFKVSVYNISGIEIFSKSFNKDFYKYTYKLDLSNLNSGSYNLVIQMDNSKFTEKFIIVK